MFQSYIDFHFWLLRFLFNFLCFVIKNKTTAEGAGQLCYGNVYYYSARIMIIIIIIIIIISRYYYRYYFHYYYYYYHT